MDECVFNKSGRGSLGHVCGISHSQPQMFSSVLQIFTPLLFIRRKNQKRGDTIFWRASATIAIFKNIWPQSNNFKHKNGEAKRRRDDERIDQETKIIKPWHFAVLFLILFLFLKNTRKVIYKRGGLFEKN